MLKCSEAGNAVPVACSYDFAGCPWGAVCLWHVVVYETRAPGASIMTYLWKPDRLMPDGIAGVQQDGAWASILCVIIPCRDVSPRREWHAGKISSVRRCVRHGTVTPTNEGWVPWVVRLCRRRGAWLWC